MEDGIKNKTEDNDADEISEDAEKSNSKLTNWSNEPTVFELKQDLIDATADTDIHKQRIRTWLDNLNVRNKAKRTPSKTRSTIVPKLIRKQAEWRYSSLSEPFLSTDDIFNIDPITYEDKQAAVQNALVLNNQFNTKLNKVSFIDDYIRTAVDEGTVIVRVGWESQEEEFTVNVPDFNFQPTNDPNIVKQLMDARDKANNVPEEFKKLPKHIQHSTALSVQNNTAIAPVHVGFHQEKRTKTIKNQPTVEVCHFQNITIDPTSRGDFDKAAFLIYSFETSLSDLKKDGKYKNLNKIRINTNSPLNEPYYPSPDERSFEFNDKPRKKFMVREYWGFWDIDNSGKTEPIVAAWVGNTLIRLEKNPFPDQKIPFVIAKYLPVRHSLYGEPDGELLADNQKIVGAVTRGMIDIMGRSANGQTGVRRDAMDETNKRKFKEGKDYEFSPAADPSTAFYMHKYPEIPQSAPFMLNLQNAEAESLTGVKAFSGSQGLSGAALGDNVGGIKSALDATAKRELGILRRLAKGVEDIGRKIISMNAEFLSEKEVVRITNDEFVEIRRDDLAGNFDLKLAISTPEADNSKAEQLAFLLQTTGQTMGPEFSQLILADIAKLRKMPALAQKIKEHKPTPDPVQQQQQQLELQLLQAQIQTQVTQAKQNESSAAFNQAKIQEIGIKARESDARIFDLSSRAELNKAKVAEITSKSDMTDLNFVEQESGTTQERDLQKLSQQAEANIKLATAKHHLDVEKDRKKATNDKQS